MKSHAQVVIIGGGIIGCSVLYHLTKLGWKDVVLCERKELTSGSSWHAAGGFHALNSDPNVARLQAYTIKLYREIETLSGQNVGLHFTGGLNVAASVERWNFLRADAARHRVLGLNTSLVSASQIRDLCPLMDVSEVLGGIYDPMEGHLDPYGATHAFAKAARLQGAEINRHTRVSALEPRIDGTWRVITDKGTIIAEHVVNAAGLWAREVGCMAGVHVPIVPMEHHYLLTEELPQLKNAQRELPLVLDLDGEIYLRQEQNGVLLGVYEKEATPWAIAGTSWEYGENELLPPALERLTGSLERGFRRFPTLANLGIRKIVNGPFTFSPDGNPLVGPVPGLRNFWSACGVMAGFAQGGGVGLSLAQWMIEGEPDSDIFAMDVARFGPYATAPYARARAREFYAKRFQIAYPNEVWPAGRPSKTSAIHASLQAANAVFGVSYGLEVPLYFAARGEPRQEIPTLRRSNAFARVGEECRAARSAVALLDLSSFAKYRVTGSAAASALNLLLAARLPQVGQVRITPMLSPSGRLVGDMTTARLADEEFLLFGSGYLQAWHMRWFNAHLSGAQVLVENLSDHWGGIGILGPQARTLLARIVDTEVANHCLPFMTVRRMTVGFLPATVARLSVSGELGYEIYVPLSYLPALKELIDAAGADLGALWIGAYALNSLRLEKGIGIWSREYSRDYTPQMSGLARFVAYDKSEFIGRQAALRERIAAPPHRLVTLAIEASDADATGYEPILLGKELVGFVTSGGYGHCIDNSLAMGYLASRVPDDAPLTVNILGEVRSARVLQEPAIDPAGKRMRS